MHPTWQTFLTEQGARLQGDRVECFASPEAEANAAINGNVIADCSNLGLLRFSGEDARSFLHNQLSNDVSKLQETESRLAAYCNPKGRALAVVRLFIHANSIYMLLPREILEPIAKRLRMFVLMSKVVIDDVSDEFVIMGAAGPLMQQKLSAELVTLPEQSSAVSHNDGISVLKLPQHDSRYILVGEADKLIQLWRQLVADAHCIGQPAWQLLDIRTGQPQVLASTVEAFVPQMLNLHAIDGVNFKKGCYPGQEIVARMYYLGKLKRRMYLAHLDQEKLPVAGESLYVGHSDSGQGAGQVVMASPAAKGGVDLLMVCPVNLVEAGPITLGSPDGAVLQVLALPYEVPLERRVNE
jgi:hypothetical protein